MAHFTMGRFNQDQFSDHAWQSFQKGNQIAQAQNRTHMLPEHLLLGICDRGNSKGFQLIETYDIAISSLVTQVVNLCPPKGVEIIQMGCLQASPDAEAIISSAIDEVTGMMHTYCGTHHILLALISHQENIAAQALFRKGFPHSNLPALRQAVRRIHDGNPTT